MTLPVHHSSGPRIARINKAERRGAIFLLYEADAAKVLPASTAAGNADKLAGRPATVSGRQGHTALFAHHSAVAEIGGGDRGHPRIGGRLHTPRRCCAETSPVLPLTYVEGAREARLWFSLSPWASSILVTETPALALPLTVSLNLNASPTVGVIYLLWLSPGSPPTPAVVSHPGIDVGSERDSLR